jgi:hypothetical protein
MGRIIRCRDKDGDGKADEFVHFVPDVDSPRGGHFVGDTLYLIHPPFLSSFRDTNGDGVADEKKVLVTGLGGGIEHPRGADHTTNGVRMGIDGWLYVAVGDFGMPAAKGADGTVYTLFGGGVVRVRPDGSEMEPYSLYCRNICDVAISPTLDMFARDNTNDGKGWNTRFHHYTALGDHGYPRLYQNFADEAIKPLAKSTNRSGTMGGLGGFGALGGLRISPCSIRSRTWAPSRVSNSSRALAISSTVTLFATSMSVACWKASSMKRLISTSMTRAVSSE